MKNNRIPRTARSLKVRWKVGNSASNAGEISECWKDNRGWHMIGKDGIQYYLFVGHLCNAELCEFLEVA